MVVGPTLALLKKKAIPEFKKLFQRWLNLGVWNSTDKTFTFSEEGSRKTFPDWDGETPTVVFFGYASDPDTLESATAKAVWCDEAGQKRFRLTSWEAILRRLSLAQGRVLITTTPYDLGWLKQQIYDRAARVGTDEEQPGDRDFRVIRFDSTENPKFSMAEFDRAKRDLPPWKFDLFYRGIFTRPAGQIYDCFKNTYDGKPHPHAGPATGHKCRPFKIPAHWPRIVGVDFGNVNTAAVKIAENPATRPRGGKLFSGRCYVYAEYHEGNRTEAQHVEAITAGEPEGAVLRAVGGARSEGGWRQGFSDAGLPIMEPPIPDVEVGINRGYAIINSDNLIVFDDCTKFLDEVTSYSRVLTDVGEPTDEIDEKSVYHCLDAGRYAFVFIRHTEGDILMFPEWSEFVHTCPPAWTNGKPDILPSHWRYYGGVYSRANMPFAFVLRAIDEHGTLHTMESVAFEDLTAKEQADEVGRVLNRWDIPFHKCPISGHPDMWSERNFNGVKSPGVSVAFHAKGLKLYESRAEDAHGWERIKTALKAKGAPKDATRRAFLVWDKTNENLIKLFPVVHYANEKRTDGTLKNEVAETRIMALHQALRLSEDVEPKIPTVPKKPVSDWLPFALQTDRVGGRKE